jgi:hypothetical protein
MNYTVVWLPAAEDDLAILWINAPDRAAVSAAANSIDTQLRRDPYAMSQARSGRKRIMKMPPVAVAFDVSDPDLLVTVWRIP